MFLADLYRVTAGNSSLRSFFTKRGAIDYANSVLMASSPNIGCVRLEGRDSDTGVWIVLESFGIPAR